MSRQLLAIKPAFELIGQEGTFRTLGGRVDYEAVCYNDATARSDRPRLVRLEPTVHGIFQVNRWVDWDQDIEVWA